MIFQKILRYLRSERLSHKPLIEIFIYRNRLLHNLNQFRSVYPKIKITPVLKGNAYGHGLLQVARILDGKGVPFLCVDSYFEAVQLRKGGIRSPILVIGYTLPENIANNRLRDVAFSVMNLGELRALAQLSVPAVIHLKLDTGMHRHGMLPEELNEALMILKGSKHLRLEGVFSHFADADTVDSELTRKQINVWNELVKKVRREMPAVSSFHIGATAGSFYTNEVTATHIRLGIGLYGFNASLNTRLELRPALEMKTILTSVRSIGPGERVGYNGTFTAEKTMKIASIPVGYAEGVDRRLSNKGYVSVKGIGCPIVGRVSMNITSIDVSAVPDPKVGDEVVVVSKESDDKNSIESMSRMCETISYELLARFPTTLRRTVVYR
mgnify:CR=1 FL=1